MVSYNVLASGKIYHVCDIGVEATWSTAHANHDSAVFDEPWKIDDLSVTTIDLLAKSPLLNVELTQPTFGQMLVLGTTSLHEYPGRLLLNLLLNPQAHLRFGAISSTIFSTQPSSIYPEIISSCHETFLFILHNLQCYQPLPLSSDNQILPRSTSQYTDFPWVPPS